MLKITKADDPVNVNNLSILLYGAAGLGKTSISFSADNPILIDFDGGVHRAIGRKDTLRANFKNDQGVIINNWEDIIALKADTFASYDTIIIDTLAKAAECLKDYLRRKMPSGLFVGTRLTLKGHGAVYEHLINWINTLRAFKKNIIIIAHVTENKDKNGEMSYAPEVVGRLKSDITKDVELIGYLKKNDDQTVIEFNPSSEFLAKGAIGKIVVPNLNIEKNFLQKIIDNAIEDINTRSNEQVVQEQEFNQVLELIANAKSSIDLTDLLFNKSIQKSKPLKIKLVERGTELKCKYNTTTKTFENIDEEENVAK